jgi:ATP-dependent DNA helicase RecG
LRPQILYPLFAPVTSLPGIGPRLGKLFEKLTGPHVAGLLWHLPTGLLDRQQEPPIDTVADGATVTLKVQVTIHLPPLRPRQPYRVSCVNDSGAVDLVFFNPRVDYIQNLLPPGEWRVVSGRVERYAGTLNMVHPDYILPPERMAEIKRLEPTYGLTAGLTPRLVLKAVAAAIERAPDMPEWIDGHVMKRHQWPKWKAAIEAVHKPSSATDLDPGTLAHQRLAYDELLASQVALALVRQHNRRLAGRPCVATGALTSRVKARLPYDLTASQRLAIEEIANDMASPQRMLRLLQGDVGSGKTVVALFAMLIAAEAGGQAALLAPTDLLARQHFATLEPLLRAAGLELRLLTGRDKGKTRDRILSDLASGEIKLVVGTHALVQESIVFDDLRLAVVDEQHRFGVQQRVALSEKGKGVDLLAMTATPIPRTLTLTAYGDIDVSRLTEKPPGRLPIDTRTIPLDRLGEVAEGLRRATAQGSRAYWVCPLVDESELIDLAAATERHEMLKTLFGDRVGLVHGQQKAAERDKTMAQFQAGEIDILVATTVIEVGVDVPQATVMVIEHAERFGLAQLHQLRGRVGRGSAKSSCLLLYQTPLSETAKARLNIMRETEDGFRIAEEDLRLRGAGELLGTRQSGLPEFHLADLVAHADLIQIARDDARLVLEKDPELVSERGLALRVLLYLFEKDAVVKTIRSG